MYQCVCLGNRTMSDDKTELRRAYKKNTPSNEHIGKIKYNNVPDICIYRKHQDSRKSLIEKI